MGTAPGPGSHADGDCLHPQKSLHLLLCLRGGPRGDRQPRFTPHREHSFSFRSPDPAHAFAGTSGTLLSVWHPPQARPGPSGQGASPGLLTHRRADLVPQVLALSAEEWC